MIYLDSFFEFFLYILLVLTNLEEEDTSDDGHDETKDGGEV